jgi:hypothetical protein
LSNKDTIYNAEISAGSLLLNESREIARFLLRGGTNEDWYQALVVDNILQKKSPSTAKRMAKLIRNRLECTDAEHWQLVVDPDREVAVQALLVAAVKHSSLLKDFINQVVRGYFRTFKRQLTKGDWRVFMTQCENLDPVVSGWSESTQRKLGQVIFRILAESGYLDSARNKNISPIHVTSKIRQYLLEHDQDNILHCLEIDR